MILTRDIALDYNKTTYKLPVNDIINMTLNAIITHLLRSRYDVLR